MCHMTEPYSRFSLMCLDKTWYQQQVIVPSGSHGPLSLLDHTKIYLAVIAVTAGSPRLNGFSSPSERISSIGGQEREVIRRS